MNLRPRDRIALCVVLVAGLLGGYYLLALKPEQKKGASLQAAIATQQQALATAQQNYNQGRAAEASLHTDAAEWSSLRLAVPAQSDIPGLLRVLQKASDAAKVQMQAITLNAANPGATTTGTGAPATAGATAVPIQLTFKGGYVALNNLVRKIDGLVGLAGGQVHATGPLMTISQVSLSGAPDLTVQLTASIYQLPAPSTTAGATTGG